MAEVEERSGKNVVSWIEEAQSLGIGEVLLTSVDMDGTCLGADQELIKEVCAKVNVPLIVGGGFSSIEDVSSALERERISSKHWYSITQEKDRYI